MDKIAIIGQQCAGKSTIADMVLDCYSKGGIIKFADPIYDTLKIFGQQKNRAFMQGLGDLAKEHFGQNIYVKLFSEGVKELEETTNERDYILVCDDIRFPYELDEAKLRGFKVIFVGADRDIRQQRANKLNLDFIEGHGSEIHVPALAEMADVKIDNSTLSTEELRQQVELIIDDHFNSSITKKQDAKEAIINIHKAVTARLKCGDMARPAGVNDLESIVRYIEDRYPHLLT